MDFKRHYELKGRHAYFTPSNPAWSNYDEDKLDLVYTAKLAAQRGTELHEFASNAIRLGVKLPRVSKTLNMYVNDAIGFRLRPEQPLYYSDNFFGTADTCGFKTNTLRIHDLRTGETPANMRQLEIYAALFCLEYRMRPFDITTELRIYQNDSVKSETADPGLIFNLMDKIITFDRLIELRDAEELG